MPLKIFEPPKDEKKAISGDCTILIIGELHNEVHGIQLIRALCKSIRNQVDTPATFATEHSSDADYESFRTYILDKKQSVYVTLTESLEKSGSLEATMTDLLATYGEAMQGGFLNFLYQEAEAESKKQAEQMSLLKKLDCELLLLDELKELQLGFKAIDEILDPSEIKTREAYDAHVERVLTEEHQNDRDFYMCDQILSLAPNNNFLIVQVGNFHTRSIVDKLINKGVNPERVFGYGAFDETDTFYSELVPVELNKLQLNQDTEAFGRKLYRLQAQGNRYEQVRFPHEADQSSYDAKAKEITDLILPPRTDHTLT